MVVCGCVWLCVVMCGYVRSCGVMFGYVMNVVVDVVRGGDKYCKGSSHVECKSVYKKNDYSNRTKTEKN